jgi:hypothetical protein
MASAPIPEGFVEAVAVRDRLGVHGDTWSTLLRDTGTVVYAHPSDRRRRLLREDDAAKPLQPQPIKPRKRRRDAKAA